MATTSIPSKLTGLQQKPIVVDKAGHAGLTNQGSLWLMAKKEKVMIPQSK